MPPQDKLEDFYQSEKSAASDRQADALADARTVDGKSVQEVQKRNRDVFTSMTDMPDWSTIGNTGSAMGFCLTDGETVIASKETDQRQTADTAPALPSGTDIAKHAQALGELHPDWWRNEGKHGGIRKCNTFTDRVYRDMQVPLPWDAQHVPTVHGMKEQLAQSPDWEPVYVGGQQLANYQQRPGDFAIWDKTIATPYNHDGRTDVQRHHLQHCGVLGSDGEIFYAGSGQRSGYAESDFRLMCKSPAYGPPSVIYRSKHLQ